MDDITTEQKLQLVQQIRSQYHKNQYDMSNRERILYGHHNEQASFTDNTESNTVSESLKFRCILAVMLFMVVILFDQFGIKPFGMNMQQVFDVFAEDYRESMNEIAQTISSEIKNSP